MHVLEFYPLLKQTCVSLCEKVSVLRPIILLIRLAWRRQSACIIYGMMLQCWHRKPKSSEITVIDNSPATKRLSHCMDFERTKFIGEMHKEYGGSLARIAGSNPAGSVDICLGWCCMSGRGVCVGLITRPGETHRMWCVWVWLCSLDNERALAH